VDALIAIGSFLAVIIVLVMGHELGHFLTAKWRGVRVIEFGLFFPPRLFSIKRGDTIYSINAIPLGGFVKLAGEEDPNVPGSLASKSIATRLLVLSAGSVVNLLLPVVFFAIAYMIPFQTVVGEVVVQDVLAGSPAGTAGIRAGDTIIAINGKTLDNSGDVTRYIQLNLGNQTDLLVKHSDGTQEEVTLVPRWRRPEGEGAVGISVNMTDASVVTRDYPFWRAIPMGVTESIDTFVLFKNGIILMIIGTEPAQFAGPVGIAQLTGEVARAGINPLLRFAAFLSMNLGIINIFPLPAFDGGRLAFVLLEWIRRGKRIPAKVEGIVHLVGFGLIILFFVAITYQDIARIVTGGTLGG